MIMANESARSLLQASENEVNIILRLTGNEENRRVLIGLGLVPGARIQLTRRASASGPVAVRVGDTRLALDRAMAGKIMVS